MSGGGGSARQEHVGKQQEEYEDHYVHLAVQHSPVNESLYLLLMAVNGCAAKKYCPPAGLVAAPHAAAHARAHVFRRGQVHMR